VKLYLPSHFNSQQKYPTVANIYGGPSSQMVDEKWNQHNFETYFSGILILQNKIVCIASAVCIFLM